VAEDTDWAFVMALEEDLQHPAIVLALAEGEDLRVLGIIHAVEVDAQQVGLHQSQQFAKFADVFVTVMEVVDDANVIGLGAVSQPPF
jgi:hypothetical protein